MAFKFLAICSSLENLQGFLEHFSKATDVLHVWYQNIKVNRETICRVQMRSLKISTCGEDRRNNMKLKEARVTSHGCGKQCHSPSLLWASTSWDDGQHAAGPSPQCEDKAWDRSLRSKLWQTMDGTQVSVVYVGSSLH